MFPLYSPRFGCKVLNLNFSSTQEVVLCARYFLSWILPHHSFCVFFLSLTLLLFQTHSLLLAVTPFPPVSPPDSSPSLPPLLIQQKIHFLMVWGWYGGLVRGVGAGLVPVSSTPFFCFLLAIAVCPTTELHSLTKRCITLTTLVLFSDIYLKHSARKTQWKTRQNLKGSYKFKLWEAPVEKRW